MSFSGILKNEMHKVGRKERHSELKGTHGLSIASITKLTSETGIATELLTYLCYRGEDGDRVT